MVLIPGDVIGDVGFIPVLEHGALSLNFRKKGSSPTFGAGISFAVVSGEVWEGCDGKRAIVRIKREEMIDIEVNHVGRNHMISKGSPMICPIQKCVSGIVEYGR